jgi:hypothetical protein
MTDRRPTPRTARVGTFDALATDILARPARRGRTRIVAVDGGSAAGKSTFAARLASAMGAPVLHTDDVAWWESFFGWWPLLIDGILEPLTRGEDVRYRPPAWDRRERPGAIEVPAGPAVVVEGVGASRRELTPYLDLAIWIDTDRQLALERGMRRTGEDLGFWRGWEVAEEQHLDLDRPWDRADLVVTNDPPGPPDPTTQFRIAAAPSWRRQDRPSWREPSGGDAV